MDSRLFFLLLILAPTFLSGNTSDEDGNSVTDKHATSPETLVFNTAVEPTSSLLAVPGGTRGKSSTPRTYRSLRETPAKLSSTTPDISETTTEATTTNYPSTASGTTNTPRETTVPSSEASSNPEPTNYPSTASGTTNTPRETTVPSSEASSELSTEPGTTDYPSTASGTTNTPRETTELSSEASSEPETTDYPSTTSETTNTPSETTELSSEPTSYPSSEPEPTDYPSTTSETTNTPSETPEPTSYPSSYPEPTDQPTTTENIDPTTTTKTTTPDPYTTDPPPSHNATRVCVFGYRPSPYLYVTDLTSVIPRAWSYHDELCLKTTGYQLLQKGYKEIHERLRRPSKVAVKRGQQLRQTFDISSQRSIPCRNLEVLPLRLHLVNGRAYWLNRYGLEDEELSAEDYQNMENVTHFENGTLGALRVSTGKWFLVPEYYTFINCTHCELASRKNIRLPIYTAGAARSPPLPPSSGVGNNTFQLKRAGTPPVARGVRRNLAADEESPSDDPLAGNAAKNTCPWNISDGLEWKETEAGGVLVQRNGSVLYSRECVRGASSTTWNPVWSWIELWDSCDDVIIDDSNSTAVLNDAAETLSQMAEYPVLSRQLGEVLEVTARVVNLDANVLGENINTTRGVLQDFEHILQEMVLEDGRPQADVSSEAVSALVSDVVADDEPIAYGYTMTQGGVAAQFVRINDTHWPADTRVVVVLPAGLTSLENPRTAFAVFTNDNAFPSMTSENRYRVASRVVNVIYNGTIPADRHVEIRFQIADEYMITRCVYWDFDVGNWLTDGCELLWSSGNVYTCACAHLTHFALQVTGHPTALSPANQLALDVITFIGCSLSLAGLAFIAATGLIDSKWRGDLSHRLLLHMAAALFLNIVSFLLASGRVTDDGGAGCIVIGVLLHYSLLACFCLMLVLSVLQTRRLTTIVSAQGRHYLMLKVILFGWMLPTVPIITLLAIDPHLYTARTAERGFCYPEGPAFYASVFAPISLILVVNLILFTFILFHVYSCWTPGGGLGGNGKIPRRHGISDTTLAMRRLRTGVFLFFLFGLPWIFGLLIPFGIAFDYLFTILATLQGFVLFLFLMVLDHRQITSKWKIFSQRGGYRFRETLSTSKILNYSNTSS